MENTSNPTDIKQEGIFNEDTLYNALLDLCIDIEDLTEELKELRWAIRYEREKKAVKVLFNAFVDLIGEYKQEQHHMLYGSSKRFEQHSCTALFHSGYEMYLTIQKSRLYLHEDLINGSLQLLADLFGKTDQKWESIWEDASYANLKRSRYRLYRAWLQEKGINAKDLLDAEPSAQLEEFDNKLLADYWNRRLDKVFQDYID